MTTLIPFTPNNSNSPPFQTILTLDGVSYNGSVTWNLAGQRWYLTITDQAQNVIWHGAMIGSPLTYDIYLAPNIFKTSAVLYREDTGNFEVNP